MSHYEGTTETELYILFFMGLEVLFVQAPALIWEVLKGTSLDSAKNRKQYWVNSLRQLIVPSLNMKAFQEPPYYTFGNRANVRL